MFKKGIEIKELTKEEVLQIPQLVKDGKKYKEIATAFGVHENTIKNWVGKLRKAGYKVESVRGQRAMLDILKDNKD